MTGSRGPFSKVPPAVYRALAPHDLGCPAAAELGLAAVAAAASLFLPGDAA